MNLDKLTSRMAHDRLIIGCFLGIFIVLHMVQLNSLVEATSLEVETVETLVFPFEMLMILLLAWVFRGFMTSLSVGIEIRERNTLLTVVGIAAFAAIGLSAFETVDMTAVDRLAFGSFFGLYAMSPILSNTPELQRLSEYLERRFGTPDEEVA